MKVKNVTPQRHIDKDSFNYESDENEKNGNEPKKDAITEMIKSVQDFTGPVIANWTDTYLEANEYGKRKKLYISRYFMDLKLALDTFYTETEYTQGFTDFKRKNLNEHGIRYMVLTPIVSFTQSYTEAMSQKVK